MPSTRGFVFIVAALIAGVLPLAGPGVGARQSTVYSVVERFADAGPARADQTAASVAVQFNRLAQAAGERAQVRIALPQGLDIAARLERLDQFDGGAFVASGPLVDGHVGEVSLSVVGDTLVGRIVMDGQLARIRPAGGAHVVEFVDQSSFPPEGQPLVPAQVPGESEAVATATQTTPQAVAADTGQVVDVLVAYTPAARDAAGGDSAIAAIINQAVSGANTAYASSGLTRQLRLVRTMGVAYAEDGDSSTDLTRLTNAADGYLDEIHAARDAAGADFVTLLTASADLCGIAWIMGPSDNNMTFARSAFSVVNWSCAASNLSLAHEIGHNMGLNHDRENATGVPVTDYAYGYRIAGVARDVMAYPCEMQGLSPCPRRTIFSTPLFDFSGTAAAAGTATEDAARALGVTAITAANFRDRTCTYVASAHLVTMSVSGGTGSISLVASRADCAWTVTAFPDPEDPATITVTGSRTRLGSGTVDFTVPPATGTSRTFTMYLGPETVTIEQGTAAASCAPSVAYTGPALFPSGGGTGSFTLTFSSACANPAWSAASASPWLVVGTPASGVGNAVVPFAVQANAQGADRANDLHDCRSGFYDRREDRDPDRPHVQRHASHDGAGGGEGRRRHAADGAVAGSAGDGDARQPWRRDVDGDLGPALAFAASRERHRRRHLLHAGRQSKRRAGRVDDGQRHGDRDRPRLRGAVLRRHAEPAGHVGRRAALWHGGHADRPDDGLGRHSGHRMGRWLIRRLRGRHLAGSRGRPGFAGVDSVQRMDLHRPGGVRAWRTAGRRVRVSERGEFGERRLGYLLLTNMLPHQINGTASGGQGTFTFHATATMGATLIEIGNKRVTADNDHATRPFGAIDTPTQGGAVSGVYANFGWALARGSALIPTDGSTMAVFIDGVSTGRPTYNQCRGSNVSGGGSPFLPANGTCDDDVATLFRASGALNVAAGTGRGAIGSYVFDATRLASGLHSIAWSVTDNQGRVDGIGSRNFIVAGPDAAIGDVAADAAAVAQTTPVGWTGALGSFVNVIATSADASVSPRMRGSSASRLTRPAPARCGCARWIASRSTSAGRSAAEDLVIDQRLFPLPAGSHLDANGRFTWVPAPGFLGPFELRFSSLAGVIPVRIEIVPKVLGPEHGGLRMWVDTPGLQQTVSGSFVVAGWALDPQAWTGAGIDAVHVWAVPVDQTAAPQFLGAATLAVPRPDVAAAFGPQYDRAGYSLVAPAPAPGMYDLIVYAHTTRTGQWEDARVVRVRATASDR